MTSFKACQVSVGEVFHRGVEIACGHCGQTDRIPVNTFRGPRQDDLEDSFIRRKFEKLGWLVAKRDTAHRCPKCFTAIKVAAVKKKGQAVDKKPVIQLATVTPEPRQIPGREEKRIIYDKLNEVYINEHTGYMAGWSDQRIADEFKIPRKWVGDIREEMFGPDIDETSQATISEAKAVVAELQTVVDKASDLQAKLNTILTALGR